MDPEKPNTRYSFTHPNPTASNTIPVPPKVQSPYRRGPPGYPPCPSPISNLNLQSNPLPGNEKDLSRQMLDQQDPIKRSMMVARYKLATTYRYPADLDVALCHRQANRLGKKDIQSIIERSYQNEPDEIERLRICPCCENMMITEQFPARYHTYLKEVQKDGEKNELPLGICMFFTFIKMTIYFLILRFLVFDVYSLYLSSKGHYCANLYNAGSSDPCVISYSAYNLKAAANQSQLEFVDVLSLIYVILAIVFFIIFRKILTKQKNLFIPFPFFKDSSFSILIEDIPPFIFDDQTSKTNINYQYENQLEDIIEGMVGDWLKYLQENRDDPKLPRLDKDCIEQVINATQMDVDELKKRSVAAVTVCYDLTELINIEKMREKLLLQYTTTENNDECRENEQEKHLLKHIPNQIRQLNQQYVRLCNHFIEDQQQFPGFKLTHFTGKAFISFEYEHYRDYFIRETQQDEDFLKISGKSVKVSYANQPNDVKWENMRITQQERASNVRYSWAVLIMLLILSFAAFFGLQMWQNFQQTQTQFLGISGAVYGFVISALQGLVNFIINTTLAFSMNLLSVFERHKTKSDRLTALAVKVIVTQSINTVFMYGIFYLFHYANPLGSFGIVNKVFNVVLIGCLVNLLFTIIPIPPILSWFSTRKYRGSNKPINMFQIQLNKKFQLPEFDFATQYAFYIVQIYAISFYGYINPFSTPIAIIFFYFQYWAVKYNVFKRFSCPVDLSVQFTEMMVTAFEISIFLFAVGFFLWDTAIHYSASFGDRLLSIFGMILSGAYVSIFLFTKEAFQNKIFFFYNKPDLLSYSDYMTFKVNKYAKTFFSENPSTALFRDIDTIANYIDASRKNKDVKESKGGLKRTFSYQPTFQKYIKEKIDEHFLDDNGEQKQEASPQLRKKSESSQDGNLKNILMQMWLKQEQSIMKDKIRKSQEGRRRSEDPNKNKPSFAVPEGEDGPKFNQFDLMYHEGARPKQSP